jgi:hypothetical protein
VIIVKATHCELVHIKDGPQQSKGDIPMSERIIELTMHELESVVGGVGHEHRRLGAPIEEAADANDRPGRGCMLCAGIVWRGSRRGRASATGTVIGNECARSHNVDIVVGGVIEMNAVRAIEFGSCGQHVRLVDGVNDEEHGRSLPNGS